MDIKARSEVQVMVNMIYDDIKYLCDVTCTNGRMSDKSMQEIVKAILNRISIISNSAKATIERES